MALSLSHDMSTAHPSGSLWIVAVGLALVGVILAAVLGPRLFGLDEVSWWVTIGVGVIVGAAVVIYGYAKRDTGESETITPDP